MIAGAYFSIAMGLAAALAWGAGDFSGGLASRRSAALPVTLWAEMIGLAMLVLFSFNSPEPALPLRNWILAGLAGVAGGIGLTLLYHALATGQMSIAAPISSVLGAAVPVLVGALTIGLPEPTTLLGLALAIAAIALIAGGEGEGRPTQVKLRHLGLPMVAGLTFGLYFVLINWASVESTFRPLIAARLAAVIFLAGVAAATRQPWAPPRANLGLVALCGVLDTGANWFYVIAGRHGRMDVAAVLGSLYPGITALLAWLILKERLNRPQLLGVAFAFAAIVLITL